MNQPRFMALRLFFTALEYFTRIPKPRWVGFEPDWLPRSAPWFPAVGLVVGSLCALVYWLLDGPLGHSLAVLAALAAGVLVTGAFHEDGWADSCDAIGAGSDRQRMLAIMRDSRLGTYGVLGVVFMLLATFEIMRQLPGAWLMPGLVLAHAWSRVGPLAIMASLDYLRDDESRAKPVVSGLSAMAVLGGTLLASLPLLMLAAWVWITGHPVTMLVPLLAATGACLLAQALYGVHLAWRIGGYTGDLLGATQQLGTLAFWLALFITVQQLWGLGS